MKTQTSTPNYPSTVSNIEKNSTEKINTLSGDMTTSSLVLSVLAFSAPMAIVTGYMPLAISTAGIGAPLLFLIAMMLLLFFAIGYLEMTKYISKTGNFYLYINQGFGKTIGHGSAFLALFSYITLLGNAYIFLGVAFEETMASFLNIHAGWWVWTAMGWVIVTILGYLNIELSSKVMTTVMVLELLFIMTFNATVMFMDGPAEFTVQPLSPTFLEGSLALGVLYAIVVFIGFEATTIYRDETRNPEKTIPRATYISIFLIGLLYALSCYFIISILGQEAKEISTQDPIGIFPTALKIYMSNVFIDLKNILVPTSLLAAVISCHNVSSRYIYNLSREKVLFDKLGTVHQKHRSPHIASHLVAILVAVMICLFLMEGKGPEATFAAMCGIAATGIVMLMGLTSLSVLIWFLRKKDIKRNIFSQFISPLIAFICFLLTTIYLLANIELLVGGTNQDAQKYLYMLIFVFIFGSILSILRKKNKTF